jgi:hypothetical protein
MRPTEYIPGPLGLIYKGTQVQRSPLRRGKIHNTPYILTISTKKISTLIVTSM